jgi:hypothetical protein
MKKKNHRSRGGFFIGVARAPSGPRFASGGLVINVLRIGYGFHHFRVKP